MKTLVIIPTYNERANLESIVARVLACGEPDIDLLIVDDGSPDGTGELADALVAATPQRVTVLHRQGKNGLGTAYLAGFKHALEHGYEAACEMDADGSHEPESLPALMDAVARGSADVAIGSRRVPGGKIEGWGPHRHFMSSAAAAFSRHALGLDTHDVTAGFRCYRATVLGDLLAARLSSDGYAFQEEAIFHCERLGYRVCEIPIVFRDRTAGESKLTWKEIPAFFATILRLILSYGRIDYATRQRRITERSPSK